jgi:iron-sulfur cluster assembly protein
MKISEDMAIGEIVNKYPESREIIANYGLHCAGCSVAAYEGIGDGARGHGMSEDDVKNLLKDLNEIAAKSEDSVGDEIKVSARAIDKIRELQTKQKKEGKFFRIGLEAGGCSGLSYIFDFDDKKENDLSFDKNGLTLIVNKKDYEKVKGSKIDFIETLQESGFKVSNPNAASSCACGSSFS